MIILPIILMIGSGYFLGFITGLTVKVKSWSSIADETYRGQRGGQTMKVTFKISKEADGFYHVKVLDLNDRQMHHYKVKYKTDVMALQTHFINEYSKPKLRVQK